MRISERIRQATSAVLPLNQLLADMTVFAQKIRYYHWCVTGQNFFDLHDQFSVMYDLLAKDIDDVAERIRQLDGIPVHTLTGAVAKSKILEATDDSLPPPWTEMVRNVLDDLGTLKVSMDAVHALALTGADHDTANMVETKAQVYAKHEWFLRVFSEQ
jgi:starvation-inducible DNA-binding protein